MSGATFEPFEPRVAVASLSGESDAAWARRAAPHVGCTFMGGIALDAATREAARAMVEDRDRTEFLPADPVEFVERELSELADAPVRGAFNVRTTTLDPLRHAAEICADRGAILEVNAHCRQDEICAAGGGETLLRETDRLAEQVRTASGAGAAVSVKVRAEVDGVDLVTTARACERAGADVFHVDAMDSEPVIADLREATDLFLIANNGVRDRETAHEYLGYGADAVSVGRPSDDPELLERVRRAVEEWFEAHPPGPGGGVSV
ncbi:tRNA-dihydrouridine synthase [Salinirubellus sp. GCM10025818]|uniref:tRNA-dihydrouridine synthase n=1 Tax=Salinirubellus TaxID=2162630 RepID=UPI0030D17652